MLSHVSIICLFERSTPLILESFMSRACKGRFCHLLCVRLWRIVLLPWNAWRSKCLRMRAATDHASRSSSLRFLSFALKVMINFANILNKWQRRVTRIPSNRCLRSMWSPLSLRFLVMLLSGVFWWRFLSSSEKLEFHTETVGFAVPCTKCFWWNTIIVGWLAETWALCVMTSSLNGHFGLSGPHFETPHRACCASRVCIRATVVNCDTKREKKNKGWPGRMICSFSYREERLQIRN